MTVELVCISERVVVGTLSGMFGLSITAKSAVRFAEFDTKWKPNIKWTKAMVDGLSFRCPRCYSELCLKAMEDTLETALEVKMTITLGGSRFA